MNDESRTYCAIVYMKSGNVITLPNLESFNVYKNSLGELSKIDWTISPNTKFTYVISQINLHEVEAIIIEEEEPLSYNIEEE